MRTSTPSGYAPSTPESAPERSADRTALRGRPKFGYEPTLDGLRGLAILAVIGYHIHSLDHTKFGFLKGGFFGVELFFVVSGYLITSLLNQEQEQTGTISLRSFWIRRARRLLPALFAMLVAISTAAVFWRQDTLGRLRRDMPWALLYASNWGQIFDSTNGYFAQLATPPLLRHLWSLAVEEQWYLLWPLVFGLLITRLKRHAALVMIGAGLAAALLGFLLADGSDGRTNFVYLSTITRASGLLLGSALALLWKPWQSRTAATRRLPVLDGAALVALLIFAFGVIRWANTSSTVYHGGMLVMSLASCVLIAAVVHPGAAIARSVFQSPALVAVGRRSYGLYLWHWPILVLTEAVRTWPRLLGALILTAGITEASFHFVEEPLRRGWLGRWWQQTAGSRIDRIAATVAVLGLLVPLTMVVGRAKIKDLVKGGDAAAFELKTAETPATTNPTNDQAAAVAATTSTSDPKSLPIKLVIVGDSQAQALAVNPPSGIERFFQITDGSVDGCGVWDDGEIWTRQGYKRPNGSCVGWDAKWGKIAAQSKADVALVTIGAWDVFDVAYREGVAAFNTTRWDQKFTASLNKGIAALAAAGTKVGLLEIPCMHPISAPGAAVPPLAERGEKWRTDHVNQLLKTIAANSNGAVTFIAGPTEWCNNPTIAADTNYRWDGVHVYKPGAKLILETVAPAVLQIAGR